MSGECSLPSHVRLTPGVVVVSCGACVNETPALIWTSCAQQIIDVARHYFGFQPRGRVWADDAVFVVRRLVMERKALDDAQAQARLGPSSMFRSGAAACGGSHCPRCKQGKFKPF